MKLLVLFVVLNIVNVILQTAKSLATVKCGKVFASIINAVAYSLYTVVIFYTMCELPLLVKALVVGICNLIGVYVVKSAEEHLRKDKLWKIEMTVNRENGGRMIDDLKAADISFNYLEGIGKYTLFNCYSATQKESEKVKEIALRNDAKYFVTETKIL